MKWDKIQIKRDNGEMVDAQAPVIISASRSTDIPAFYADWFFERLNKGYVAWKNPFNGVYSYVSFKNTRLIVFWSKNPKPLLDYLDELKNKNINCYIQFTLNDYVQEQLEINVPSVEERIETFKKLVDKLGKGKVIWRFDPLILTKTIDVNELLRRIKRIGDELKGYTEKLVFSYADISIYKKVKKNLENNLISYREFTQEDMVSFAEGLYKLNKDWNFAISTCAEKIPLERYNIQHNKCIDDDLMIKYFSHDKVLMDFLKIKIIPADMFNPNERIEKRQDNKDKGQREFCGCIISKDIGEYNTCPHLCEYCYANASKEIALKNWELHQSNKDNETIKGE
jgi:DNA repair photolyase